MGPPDLSSTVRAISLALPVDTAASQTDLVAPNGPTNVDLFNATTGYPSGVGLVVFNYAISAGSVTAFTIQQADDSGFTTNAEAVTLTALGTETASAFAATGVASSTQVRAMRIDGRRKYIRARYTSAAATAGEISCVLIVGGFHNYPGTTAPV